MATGRNNYWVRRRWRSKLVLQMNVTTIGHFLNKHIRIHHITIKFNTIRICWVFLKNNKKQREKEKVKERRRRKEWEKEEHEQDARAFLSSFTNIQRHFYLSTTEKISMREKITRWTWIYCVLRFTQSIITSSFSLSLCRPPSVYIDSTWELVRSSY
jgi:hypothetical protein